MARNVDGLEKENQQLKQENDALSLKLQENNEIIKAIKKGNIDAVLISRQKGPDVLVTVTADQAYRRFIENMSEGVVTLQPGGIILYSNSSFAQIVHLPLQKVIGANLLDLIPVQYIEIFERMMSGNYPENTKVELSVLNQTNKHIYFIVSFKTLHLEDIEALNLVWTDVTDQKEAEEKLVLANINLTAAIEQRILSQQEVVLLNNQLKENIAILKETNGELASFAHIASHDLQEPIRKIITYSDLLQHNYFTNIDTRGQGYIDKMHRACLRMRNLINDILEYSLVSQAGVVASQTDLQSVFNEIFSDLEVVIKETKAKITIEKHLPVIEANGSQMRQLFQNIISNSLKFIKAGTVPKISVGFENIQGKKTEGNGITEDNLDGELYCRLYIRDNGIGFDPVYAAKIFVIFQRLNNNADYRGTGIGLAICKKIVSRHGGLITAESILDKGALFTITLPYQQKTSLPNTEKKLFV